MSDLSNIIVFEKDKYTEDVIRKSLYWLSEKCKWKLCDCSSTWEIEIQDSEDLDSNIFDFHRLLNDFLLREKLDKETGSLRKKVISASLSKMCEGSL